MFSYFYKGLRVCSVEKNSEVYELHFPQNTAEEYCARDKQITWSVQVTPLTTVLQVKTPVTSVGVGVVDVSEIVGVDVTGMGVKVGVGDELPTTVIDDICASGQSAEENHAPPFRCKSKWSEYVPFADGAVIDRVSVVGGLPMLVSGR